MTPQLNISQAVEYFNYLASKFRISGATNPGVPHFGNKYSFAVSNVASPKSPITKLSTLYYFSRRRFYGFKSR